MKTLKRVLTLTLALMLTLTLLAPAAAATESDTEDTSYFTFSNEPVGYAIATVTAGTIPTRYYLTMVVPDGTTCTLTVPVGGHFSYNLYWIDENNEPDFDGGIEDYETGDTWTEEVDKLCLYTIRADYAWETVNVVTQSQLDKLTAVDESMVEIVMLAADQATSKTSKTMELADGWAVESVDKAVLAGLRLLGKADLRENITRSEFAQVAVRLYEAMGGEAVSNTGADPFIDVEKDWGYISQAYALGIVKGTNAEGTLFDPDGLVTREQAAVMLSRVYEKLGGTIPATSATTFADDGKVSGYAKSAVAFMADKGIVGGVGDNQFNPQGNAKCEEALIIALRMLENLK